MIWVVVAGVVLLAGLAALGFALACFSGELAREDELQRARRRAWSIHDEDDAA